jgi:hypothetical protein
MTQMTLDEMKKEYRENKQDYLAPVLASAIEQIERVDGVCEWRYAREAHYYVDVYTTGCGEDYYSASGSNDEVYCLYCGKRIEVVDE